MAGGGKGSTKSTTQVKLPQFLERAAEENIALADQVGRVGFMPNLGPTVAGFSPGQTASMANTNQAAQAFGLQQAGPMGDYMMGDSFNNGAAYGAGSIYDQMLAGLSPEQQRTIMALMQGGVQMPGQQGQPQQQPTTADPRGGGAMWSDGMTGAEIRQHQADRTFGNTVDTRSEYERQMDRYNRSAGGISIGGGNTAAGATASARSGGLK